MRVFTIYPVIQFPQPWPGVEIEIFSQKMDDCSFSLSSDRIGHLIFDVTAGDSSLRFTSQPVRVIGISSAIIAVTRNDDLIEMRLNGERLLANEDAEGEVYTLCRPRRILSKDPLDYILSIDCDCAADKTERFFLNTLQDIHSRQQKAEYYEMIRCAGTLRQLLLDGGSSLVHLVNKKYHIKISFTIVPFPQEILAAYTFKQVVHNIYPGVRTKVATENMGLDSFLGISCLQSDGIDLSIKDVIRICSNIIGGIHMGNPTTPKERQLAKLSENSRCLEKEVSILLLEGICRVTLLGLRPLVDSIVGLGSDL